MPGRVFMDDNYHLVEIDVRDPAKPVKVSRHAMPTSVSRLEIVDGRLFAFTGTGGMQVFRFGKNDARDD